MRRLLLLILFIGVWAFTLKAQTPYWITNPPVPTNNTFYYRVTIAEGKNYKDAYAEAFAIAIYESYSKLVGVAVNINTDKKDIKDGVLKSISSESGQMRLPINKVCEFREDMKTSSGIRLYVLWQVANSALVDPQFDIFTQCE